MVAGLGPNENHDNCDDYVFLVLFPGPTTWSVEFHRVGGRGDWGVRLWFFGNSVYSAARLQPVSTKDDVRRLFDVLGVEINETAQEKT